MRISLIILTLVTSALAVPPLTPAQKQLLELANDRSAGVDEPAWYPLLENAIAWPKDEKPSGAKPNYDAILKSPGEYRGTLFEIEGEFPRKAKTAKNKGEDTEHKPFRLKKFRKPGPWEDKHIEEWQFVVEDGPEVNDERIAIVYVVDPPKVESGDRVKVVGRFYKIRTTKNQHDQMMDYAVFVGGGAEILPRSIAPAVTKSTTNPVTGVLLGIVLALVFGFFMLRSRLKAIGRGGKTTAIRTRRLERLRAHEGEDEEEEDEPEVGLPEDPVAALAELERRGEE